MIIDESLDVLIRGGQGQTDREGERKRKILLIVIIISDKLRFPDLIRNRIILGDGSTELSDKVSDHL